MGNVLLAGNFTGSLTLGPSVFLETNAGSFNIVLGKLAPNGSPTWDRQIGDPNGANQVAALALDVDGSGGPILTGTFGGNVDFGGSSPLKGPTGMNMSYAFVAHYGQDDAYVFAMPLQNAAVSAAAGDATGNVFLTGSFTGPLDLGGPTPLMPSGAGDTDVFVAKLSGSGTFTWANAYGQPGSKEEAEALALTADGAPVIAGYTESPIDFGLGKLTPAATMGGQDAFVAELSP